jgi:hypothetical protein
MREVSPGDLILSFRDTLIVAAGRAVSVCYDAPKPSEFGPSGANWDNAGWKVDVRYHVLRNPFRPKDYIDRIRPLLPAKYSPLQNNGDGLQSVYLAELPQELANLLCTVLMEAGNELPAAGEAIASTGVGREQVVHEFEDGIEATLTTSPELKVTEKEQLVKARRGQGLFRENVQVFEKGCRVSGVTDPLFLIASHIKPWRVANNKERLDGENGLLLSPNIDFLFDRGFISFDDGATLLISPVADKVSLRQMGVPIDSPMQVGSFTPKQRMYLEFHRRNVFLETGREA